MQVKWRRKRGEDEHDLAAGVCHIVFHRNLFLGNPARVFCANIRLLVNVRQRLDVERAERSPPFPE